MATPKSPSTLVTFLEFLLICRPKCGFSQNSGGTNGLGNKHFSGGAHSGSVVKTERKTEQAGLLHPVRRSELLAFEDTRPDNQCRGLQLPGILENLFGSYDVSLGNPKWNW